MNIKKYPFLIVVLLLLSNYIYSQNNCNLIDSATFYVPVKNQTLQGFYVASVNNNNPPNNLGTQVNIELPVGQWSYVTITKSSTNECKLFLNGVNIFTGNYASISYNWNKLILGSQLSGGVYSNFFEGSIDEVRISNIVRSDTEILNHYTSKIPFISDASTIGLWHFDESAGTTINGVIGGNGSTNASWANGVFGNSLSYNGTSNQSTFNFTTPTTNSTIEFWIKPNSIKTSWPLMTYGTNSSGLLLTPFTEEVTYKWSNGVIGNSVTVNPTQLQYLWVTDGNCTDTVFFDSQSATIYDTTYVTVKDTIHLTITDTSYISVTDTLIIDAVLTGINPPNNINTLKIYPNPTSEQITIDFGINYSTMNGYTLKITNSLSQVVYTTQINMQSTTVDLSSWTGKGVYFVHLIDGQNSTIDIRKIILK